MKIHRFYYPFPLEQEVTIIEEKLLKQLIGVLRIESGEHIRLFNEQNEKEYEIIIASKKRVVVHALKHHTLLTFEKKVILGVAITKKDTFELIAQKATELGVNMLVPLISERTIKKDISRERIEKIIIEATEQSGRNELMKLSPVMSLTSFLDTYPNTILFDTETHPLLPQKHKETVCIIGPEGGWSEKERILFREKNILSYSLSATTLRTETAAIVAAYTLLWQ